MKNKQPMHPGRWWRRKDDTSVECLLCAHGCTLREGQKGRCGVRIHRGGQIDSLVYGRVVAEHIDPIEKKPLFHFLPGSLSYSIATCGCNFTCLHCQNAGISQVGHDQDIEHSGVYRGPEEIVESALAHGCRSISYTYVEPTIFFEYAYDCCAAAIARGVKNVFVSNGFMTKEVVGHLAGVLAAINIDLKAYTDRFYHKVCGARVQPVFDTIVRCKEAGIWVEVTTLLIPGMNDGRQELEGIASFLAAVDRSIPWHVTGYHPSHRMATPPATPKSVLALARQIGIDQGLHHVYSGNRPGSGGESTFCPSCRLLLVSRQGFRIESNRLDAGHCPSCRQHIAGIW